MSYILDALKKSEKERQRGTVPDLLTVQEDMLQLPPKRFPWRYVVLAVIVAAAGVAARMLLPLANQVPAAPAVIQQPVVEPPALPQRDLSVLPPAPLTEQRAAAKRLPVPEDNKEMDIVRPEGLPGRPLSVKAHAPVPQDSEKPAVSARQEVLPPADPEKIYRVKELPAALQKTLPPLSLSAFMYSSNPELRMVRINSQMMREGQELTAGVRLQEITADGVILTSQGYRFFVAMK